MSGESCGSSGGMLCARFSGVMNFDQRPFTVVWETTRACDLRCLHCRAEAVPRRNPLELTTKEALNLVRSIKEFGSPYPIFVLTGGDPLKRPDIYDIVSYAAEQGLRVAMTPSATPLVTRAAIQRLAEAGLIRLAVSLDGKNSLTHDGFRGVEGSFRQTQTIIDWCREFGLETQIHTTVTRYNLEDLPAIARLIAAWEIKLWALFCLIAVGRAARPEIRRLNLGAYDFEEIFHWLYLLRQSVPYDVTPREGYHYRRVLLQRRAQELGVSVEHLLEEVARNPLKPCDVTPSQTAARILRAPLGVNDGKGVVFVSFKGDVQPSGFLPLIGGNVRGQPFGEIYRYSPLFVQVRDFARIKGKCGACEFKLICGGSRARAYALTGDPMRSDPCCVYVPTVGSRAAQTCECSKSSISAMRPALTFLKRR